MISAVVFSCLILVISSFPTDHLIARRDTTSSEECLNKCSREVNIVCGNDGIVYPNSCSFDCTRAFLIKDLESVECPFVIFKEIKALNDLGRSNDRDDGQQSSSASKASQVFPNSNDHEDTRALLSLARIIRRVEGQEEENDDYLKTLRMYGEDTSLSNELGNGKEFDESTTVKSVTNIHQNIWNTLYALRKANQKLQAAKQAKQYVLHELDNIVLNLKDDEKMSYDPNSNVMNKVERLLKEKDQSSFTFKRHLIDHGGLTDNVLPLYNLEDNIPEPTTQLNKRGKSVNVEIEHSTDMSMESNINNEEIGMNNEGLISTTVESIPATTSDREDVIETERSHDKDDSFKEDTEYTDAPDVFPNTETLENNKRIITYDFGSTSNGNDDHLTIPFLSQTEITEDYINTSKDIEQEMDLESYRENMDRTIDEITALIDAMEEATTSQTEITEDYIKTSKDIEQEMDLESYRENMDTMDRNLHEITTFIDAMKEATTTEIVTNNSMKTTAVNDEMTYQTTSEFVEEVSKTDEPENVSEYSQITYETDHIPVLESSDNISKFEILDTDDNGKESEESNIQETDEKVEIKSRNRISDSNELFTSKSLVWQPEDNTQNFQETADDSNFKNRITESNEFVVFNIAENAQKDSTSASETDITALPISTSTDESSREKNEDVITTESTEGSSGGIYSSSSSSFRKEPSTDVTSDTTTLTSSADVTSSSSSSVDSTNTDSTSTLAANSDIIGATSSEVTTTAATSYDSTSTDDTIVGAASSSDSFVGAPSVTSEKELITSEKPILMGNEPIFIPHPVPEDSDDYDRLVYPDTSESIENIFVGDESMNLPNYLDFVDPPRPHH